MSNKVAKKQADRDRESFIITENLIKYSVIAFAFLVLFITAYQLFEEEFSAFLNWYLVITVLGFTFMPLSMMLLGRFKDSGWIVSKAIGIAGSGWMIWMLSSVRLFKFNSTCCWISVFICFGLNVVVLWFYIRKHRDQVNLFTKPSETLTSIFLAELVFLGLFIFWTYLKGFNPEAYGTTEKLMDFGFMKAMDKSDYMPPEDLWLSGENLNYYYVGQFMATYLSKLSNVGVEYGYNFMLMLIAALSFSMPCSIVLNASFLFTSQYVPADGERKFRKTVFPYFAGGLAGLAVCFCGNFHYCIYAKIIPAVRSFLKIDDMADSLGYSFEKYWFPSSTRFIGYNPETNDKTIHEFPSYSFVLGDLHAHVVNIIFVLCVVAILLGFLYRKKDALQKSRELAASVPATGRRLWGISLSEIFDPSVIAIGFFIGLFHTTNYWDYPIYFVVSGAVILFVNCVIHRFSADTLKLTLFHAFVVLAVSTVVCLPFTISFKQISTHICLCENHTPLYQLAILWGIPVLTVAFFLAGLIKSRGGSKAFKGLFGFIDCTDTADMFILILGLCAIGLVLIPEVIYVQDIYSGDYKRANTMFKLSYQAFIMFGMAMGYIIPRFILLSKKKASVIFGVVMLLLLLFTFGYFGNASNAWFGDYSIGIDVEEEIPEFLHNVILKIHYILYIIFAISFMYLLLAGKRKYNQIWLSSLVSFFILVISIVMWTVIYTPSFRYKGLNAGEYLQDKNAADYEATNWINETIEGRPVILEANGNSYTDYNRVSVRTGLPTLLGWRTHEWLWQSDSEGGVPAIITEREEDIASIYTGSDVETVASLIDKYDIEYIYVGDCEREKFTDINYGTLFSIGRVVFPVDYDFSDVQGDTYIIKVNR